MCAVCFSPGKLVLGKDIWWSGICTLQKSKIFYFIMVRFIFAFCVCVCLLIVEARPPEAKGEKKSRVYDQDLSEKEHFKEEEEHNTEYDHEAFLGKDKKKFDELTPEESKERLGYVERYKKLFGHL